MEGETRILVTAFTEPGVCKNCKHWKPRRPFVRSCRNTMSEYYGDEPEEYDGCDAWEGEEDE